MLRLIRFLLPVLLPASLSIADEVGRAAPLAPGYGELGYALPAVGSYELPPLGRAADGKVLDTDGRTKRLFDLFGDRYVLLAFMYSTCNDVDGCPLTSHVFYKIKAAMKHDPALADGLRMLSLSFDPKVDTPEVMALYGNNFRYAGNAGEWRFLTTASQSELEPILDAYGQDVLPDPVTGDEPAGYSHVLRVFLIDPERRIRNIYSVDFLHHELIINDVKTLMRQASGFAKPQRVALTQPSMTLSKPGDDKRGYESDDYRTNSLALPQRQGVKADLLSIARQPPLGLPPVPVPDDNPLTREKIELGRLLFYDRRLSLNDTFSCAMCHIPEQGFANNELAMAVGIEGRTVRRNAPTIYNSAYAGMLFHDGREETLEQQIWGPLLAKNEMGNPSVGQVLAKIRRIGDYAGRFEAAFDGRGLSMETLGMALASYQRVLISGDSPFDRWYYGGQETALDDEAKRGFELFTGKAGCASCHSIGETHALFSDDDLHNTGLGYRESMGILPEKQTVLVAPGVTLEVDRAIIEEVGATPPSDVGRYEVTQDPRDRWKYKTPGLRNVALTAPYMHNGAFTSLREVIDFYDAGGVPNELLDPRMRPLHLSDEEKDELVAFLMSLTGSNVDTLVSDAFAAPVGDLGKGDPNWVHGTQVEVR